MKTVIQNPSPQITQTTDPQRLQNAFLSRRSEATKKAYRADLCDFSEYLGLTSVTNALKTLLSQSSGSGNSLVLEYKNHLIEHGKSPATVNRRLATLKSVIKLARMMGLVSWSIEVEGETVTPYRDTKGPSRAGFEKIWKTINPNTAKGKRDRAILALLYDSALRRGEICSLDREDIDLSAMTLWVRGKGRSGQKELLTLAPETVKSLEEWVEIRGDEPGPLFTNFDRAGKGQRLTGSAVYYIVQYYGKKADVNTRPHGLRHAAVTEALDRTNGNYRAVQQFSRHRDTKTIMKYDDNREDLGGEVSRLVASGISRL